MLICSFANAQNTSPAKNKTKKQKQTTLKHKTDSVNQHYKDSFFEIHPVAVEDTSTFDPMDTTHLRWSRNALTKSVKYKCRDSIVYYADKKIIYLYGDAKVYYDDLTLTADFITIRLDKNLVTALPTTDTSGKLVGMPKFKQGAQEFTMRKIAYNFETKRASLSNLKTREGEGYVVGDNVIKNEFNELGIRHSMYTTCDADTPHFGITAAKLKVIPDKKVVALWPNLIIEGFNTPLVFPFAIFPIKKGQSSGLIIPQYGSDISRGFFLRNGGYYLGLGEHADIALTGDLYSNFSWGTHSVFRYANRYHFNGNLTFNYNANQYGLPEDPGYHGDKGFQLSWLHSQDSKARPGTSFSANVNIASSTYLAINSYNPANIPVNSLSSSVAFSKSMLGGKVNFSTNAGVSQNTTYRDISISFPDFTLNVSSFNPLKPKYKSVADKWYENITMSYSSNFKNQFTSKDSLLFRSRSASELNAYYDSTGRFGMLHNIPISTTFKLFKYYTLSTQVSITDYMYYKSIRRSWDSTDKEKPMLVTKNVDGFQNAITYRPSASLSTKFYGMAQFKNGPISAFRHVLTPTIGISYVPDFSDASYGYYKTYKDAAGNNVKYSIFENGLFGVPSMGKQGNIDFGLDNNLEMKVWRGKDTARKEEKVQIFSSLRAGGSYNLFADSLKLSMISLSAQTRLYKNISVNASSALDPYVNVIDTFNGYKSVRRINTYYLNDRQIPGVLRTANVGLSASFNQNMFKAADKKDKDAYSGELKYLNDYPSEYMRFDVPWTLTINYTIGYDRYANLNNASVDRFVQTLNYSGDFSLTKKWRIAYNSGYDFRAKQVSFTSINIVRDLHCWEFKFDWIPFGVRQSFLFTIKVKASILQELKQTRRREWFDRTI